MTTVLDDIIVGVRADLEQRKLQLPLDKLQAQAEATNQPSDPLPVFAQPGLSVIAEVKRASPSEGALAAIDAPEALAAAYEAGGASAISVLTEKHRFNGSLEDLDRVRQRVSIPILRKDFVVDEYQVYENRAHGADLTLLIVAALDDEELKRLYDLSLSLGLTPLVEVHTEEETRRAVDLGAELIGVNNRNLKTLDVDLSMFEKLVGLIPDEAIKVAESGVLTPQNAARVYDAGANAILVGTALVRHDDPTRAIEAMIATTKEPNDDRAS